jgi:hypothetical protein
MSLPTASPSMRARSSALAARTVSSIARPSSPATARAGGDSERTQPSMTLAASSGSAADSRRSSLARDSASNAPSNRDPGAARHDGSPSDIAVRNSPGATTVTAIPVPASSAPST